MFNLFGLFQQKILAPTGANGGRLRAGSQLTTGNSPFSIREQDEFHLAPKENVVSFDEIDFLINKKVIGSLEVELLSLLNDLIFATSIQLTDALVAKGITVTQKRVQQRLRAFTEKNITSCISFSSADGVASFRAYCIGDNGIYLLRKYRKKPYQIGFAQAAAVVDIKRTLATNQLLTKLHLKHPIFYRIRQTLWCEEQPSRIVRPQAIITTSTQQYLVECVRDLEHTQGELLEKYKRYQEVIEHYKEMCIPLTAKPVLLFLTENLEDIVKLSSILKKQSGKQPQILYCCDGEVYSKIGEAFYSTIG